MKSMARILLIGIAIVHSAVELTAQHSVPMLK